MTWIKDLLLGQSAAHSIFLLCAVIAAGVLLGRVKIRGISFGVTWILFVGIAAAHFGMRVDRDVLHVFQEFGLILFVFSIGLQLGPGFFSSFKKGGVTLNLLAAGVVALGVITTCVIYVVTDLPMATMVGIMSGAVAYPLAVVGIISTMLLLRYAFKVDLAHEEQAAAMGQTHGEAAQRLSLRVTNPALHGLKVGEIREMIGRNFVVSRMHTPEGVEMVNADTQLHVGDEILVITSRAAMPTLTAFIGEQTRVEWEAIDPQFTARPILITKRGLNGKTLSQLRLRSFGASITRVSRSGIDLVAHPALQLQIGDRVTVVGTEQAIAAVERKLGNSLRMLDHPNIFVIFVGIVLGVVLGSIPFAFPGIPQAVKLGLAGGPLIVAILVSRFGPRYKLITYTTLSANLMLREVGIALFLACVGLGAGQTFIATIAAGGYKWIGYGVLITLVPLLAMGVVGRVFCKLNYLTLSGMLAGSMTDPPALAYANDLSQNDIPAVGYATVYPLTMFLRVLCAQLMILMFV